MQNADFRRILQAVAIAATFTMVSAIASPPVFAQTNYGDSQVATNYDDADDDGEGSWGWLGLLGLAGLLGLRRRDRVDHVDRVDTTTGRVDNTSTRRP